MQRTYGYSSPRTYPSQTVVALPEFEKGPGPQCLVRKNTSAESIILKGCDDERSLKQESLKEAFVSFGMNYNLNENSGFPDCFYLRYIFSGMMV